jgi:hypothetical protein
VLALPGETSANQEREAQEREAKEDHVVTDRLPLEQCASLSDAELDEQIKVRCEMYAETTGGWLATRMTIGEIPELKALKTRAKGHGVGQVEEDMDQSKLKTLRVIGYQVRATCGLCRHASVSGEWGTCDRRDNEYRHEKHVGEPRKLSIHRSGWCSKFEPRGDVEVHLHGFAEFMEGP